MLGSDNAPVGSRRLVTIVFCDLVDSTKLGERLDPEALRAVMSTYFRTMAAVIERHGGTVEKFIGDAIVAVFGIPTLHEDDALRAVRAADEMRDAIVDLNLELRKRWDVEIQVRLGVNSGEVMAGDDQLEGQAFVTGGPVNLAARLEQHARPGQVLLGPDTVSLVRDAVRVEPLPPLALKGLGEQVIAAALLEVGTGVAGHARRMDLAIVDRERELALLLDAFDRSVAARQCQLFTILGIAGVGKSRTVEELLSVVGGRATSLRGRCLAYGEGITFWPIKEMVHEAIGLSVDDDPHPAASRLAQILEPAERGTQAAGRVGEAIGIGGIPAAPEETFWAIRTLFETLARQDPLVLVFDDIQWAEPTLLALIEHIADWSRDVPMMLVCLARPDLLEIAPTWGGGKLNATSVLLEPLSEPDAAKLIQNLVGTTELDAGVRDRILESAGGNPLFVEELLAMMIDDGSLRIDGGRLVPTTDASRLQIPPSISAILAARLDMMPSQERTLVDRASVIGEEFSTEAVSALMPDDMAGSVESSIGSLMRKQILRTSPTPGQYRFRHVLIRDAAYASIPKRTRASLHESLATTLLATRRSDDLDEILGYHLERAFRYLAELGPPDDHATGLAHRAGVLLAEAGRRAFARGDAQASAGLLARSAVLLTGDDVMLAGVLPDLADSEFECGDPQGGTRRLEELDELAHRMHDRSLVTLARIRLAEMTLLGDPRGTTLDAMRVVAEDAVAVFEELGDDGRLAESLMLIAVLSWVSGSAEDMLETSARALGLARGAGSPRMSALAASYVGRALALGPVPCHIAVTRLTTLIGELEHDRLAQATCRLEQAWLLAMMKRFAEAEAETTAAREVFEDLGQRRWLAAAAGTAGLIAWAAGRTDEAEERVRHEYRFFHSQGETSNATPAACDLAHVLCDLGRFAEADELVDEVVKGAGIYDVEPQAGWRSARARILAHLGEREEAERLADEAVALVAPTDLVDLRADTWRYRADVLDAIGRSGDAAADRAHAAEAYRAKGNLAGLERVAPAAATPPAG